MPFEVEGYLMMTLEGEGGGRGTACKRRGVQSNNRHRTKFDRPLRLFIRFPSLVQKITRIKLNKWFTYNYVSDETPSFNNHGRESSRGRYSLAGSS